MKRKVFKMKLRHESNKKGLKMHDPDLQDVVLPFKK